MTTIKQATWLPIFTGFYESIFDGSDDALLIDSEDEYKEYYSELFKAGISYEYFNDKSWEYIDFTKCFENASESICDALIKLDHAGIIKDVEFEKLVSPKEYNFSTDSINCIIKYDAKKLETYINEHFKSFTKFIEDRYTRRDGFIPSYSNDVNDWLDFSDLGDHQLGSVLEFVINNEMNEAVYELYEESNCREDFYNFDFDTDKMINDFKEAV